MISMKGLLFVFTHRLCSVLCTKIKYLDVSFIKKMVVREVNKKNRLTWCLELWRGTVQLHWNQDIFSYESQIVAGQNNRVYVWRSSNEAYWPESMCPPHQRKVSVMIWGCITWYGVGALCKVDGNINAIKYRDILDNHLWSVLARHFANKSYRFLDDNAPVHRACIIGEFKQDNNIHDMTWPAQSPDLNIIKTFVASYLFKIQHITYTLNWNFLLPLRIYEWSLQWNIYRGI